VAERDRRADRVHVERELEGPEAPAEAHARAPEDERVLGDRVREAEVDARVHEGAVVELDAGARADLVVRPVDRALDEEAVLEAPLEGRGLLRLGDGALLVDLGRLLALLQVLDLRLLL